MAGDTRSLHGAYYPNQASVVEKIVTYTPWWKWPAWVWTRSFGAWPSSAEWLSAMFDYNVALFFQSFVVVTVEPAARRSSSGRGAFADR